jgi:hypothetical protein
MVKPEKVLVIYFFINKTVSHLRAEEREILHVPGHVL